MPELLTFDHYELLTLADGSPHELGRGAMGITYKAFDSNLRIPVALKVINVPNGSSDEARDRFVQEARAAAQLRHRHVASVFHLGIAEETYFYAMEFIDGETVEALRQRCGPLPELVALRLTQQVARALHAAEQHGLVHRDIKPSNLMLVWEDDELATKVIDFGLAQVHASEEEGVEECQKGFVGTPHYASPEQLAEREVDGRSDLYSLGATLWFMLTGEPPFTGTMAEVVEQHLKREPPYEELRGVSASVLELLRRLLAKDPAQRFQKAVELRQAIDQCHALIAGGPVAAAARLAMEEGRLVRPLPTARAEGAFTVGSKVAERYEIRAALGSTGAGWVYQAYDAQAARLVRLLLLNLNLQSDANAFTHWEQAVLDLERLEHPSLLRTFSLEIADENAVVVQEWTEGFTLLQLLRARRKLEAAEAVRLLEPMAAGVDHAQEYGVSQLDLSLHRLHVHFPAAPAGLNSLLTTPLKEWPSFALKIDPLTLSREFSQSMTWAGGQTLVGSATSNQADVASADPSIVQTRSLAVLIYELLGGALTPTAAAKARLQGIARYSPLANLTEEGNEVLRRAVGAEKPFARAADFHYALAAVDDLEMQPFEARKTPVSVPGILRVPPLAPLVTRRMTSAPPVPARRWLPILAALVLLAGLAGAFLLFRSHHADPSILPSEGVVKYTKSPVPASSDTELAMLSSTENKEMPATTSEPLPLPAPDRRELLSAATAQAESIEAEGSPAKTIAAWLQVAQGFPESEIGRMRLEIELDALRSRAATLPATELAELNPLLHEAAGLEVVSAMMMLGELGRAKQPEEAFKWLSAAAAKGVPSAATQVGLMYANGAGVQRDFAKAAEFFQTAAEKGDAAAKAALGECYLLGKGVEKDEPKAIALLQEASARSNVRALNRLGNCYFHGLGVEKNFVEARKFFSKAADLGSNEALGNLGVIYMNGDGLPSSAPKKAVQYFQRGAEAGDGSCMYQFARCFESGTGVEQRNPALAQQWYKKAAATGLIKAIEWCRQNGVPYQE